MFEGTNNTDKPQPMQSILEVPKVWIRMLRAKINLEGEMGYLYLLLVHWCLVFRDYLVVFWVLFYGYDQLYLFINV